MTLKTLGNNLQHCWNIYEHSCVWASGMLFAQNNVTYEKIILCREIFAGHMLMLGLSKDDLN